jgi:hypothetical protein
MGLNSAKRALASLTHLHEPFALALVAFRDNIKTGKDQTPSSHTRDAAVIETRATSL